MSNPIIFNKGVKYIKLAKFDTGSASENLTTQLGEVNTIRVNYSDKGIVEYPISSITEHETYYLYRIATTDATSSADNHQPEFHFDGSKTGGSISPGFGGTFLNDLTTNDISSDTLTYDSSKGTITSLTNSPLRLGITASIGGETSGGNIMSIISSLRGNLGSLQFTTNGDLEIDTTIFKDEIFSFALTTTTGNFNSSELHFNTSSGYISSSGAQIPVILEPFFTEPFYNGDYDVLVNNTPNARRSNLFFDIDYSDNIIQAVNQQVLISSSQQGRLGAPYARIQDYNYNIDRSLTPRYKGSKSTSPGFNLSSSEGGLGILPNVEQLNVAAYSINWAGGTSPEILGAGGTSLSDILLVGDNRDDITIIPQADPNYSDTINSSVEPGDIVSFYQYGNSSAQNPQRVEVIETKLNVPPKSAYMIPSSGSIRAIFDTISGDSGINFAGTNRGVFKVNTNDSGFYISGSFVTSSTFIPEFQERFNNSKNDWYVTTYNKLRSPVIYNGPNATTNYEFTSNFTPSDPLGYYGVSKITGVVNSGGDVGLTLDRTLPASLLAQNEIGLSGSIFERGILIWESWGNSIIVRGSNLSGVGASLVYSEFAPKALTDNLDYISRTYTNKS